MPSTKQYPLPESSPAQLAAGCERFTFITQHFHDELFFLGNRLLGKREVFQAHTNEGMSAIIINQLYFCPVCGEVWARRFFDPHSTYNRGKIFWQAISVYCKSHGDGKIIRPEESTDNFPAEVYRNDVLLLKEL